MLKRELAPLLSIRDAFPKVLITRTRREPYTREGVLVLDLARWPLGEQGFRASHEGYRATGHVAPFAPAWEAPAAI